MNVFVFKEPIGKAAFKAIGAGLGAWILGAVGSIVPGFGTLLGGIIGGLAGDALGGLMYDVFFAKKSGLGDELDEKTNPTQTKTKDLSATALTGGTAGAITALQKGKIKAPKVKPKAKGKPKPKTPQIRGKKTGAKAVRQFKKSFTKQRQKLTKAVRPVTRALKPVTQKATKAITKNIVKPATKVATSASKSLTKNIVKPASKVATTTTKAVTAAAKGATKGATTAGKAGLKAVSGTLKAAKKIISPIVKKIPFLGPIVDFLLNVFVFKEPLGRSAFMAVGAGLGTWVGGALGTLVPLPGIGTAIGMFLGGAGGDLLGGLLYDKIFAGKEDKEKGDKDLKGDEGESSTTSENYTEIAGERVEEGKPLSAKQEMAVELGKAMGNDYSGLDTYADYEEGSGSTTYVVTQKRNPTTNTGTDQQGGVEQVELASLSLNYSGSSSNWSKELQKR